MTVNSTGHAFFTYGKDRPVGQWHSVKKIVGRRHASAGHLPLLSVLFWRSMLAAARRSHDPALHLAVLTLMTSARGPAFFISCYWILGRDAAATDWPTRRIFSSGRVTLHLAASSGYSSERISLQTRRMVSPPLPDMTRPSSIMYSMS